MPQTVTTHKTSFPFVLRFRHRVGGFRMRASAGRYCAVSAKRDQLTTYHHEFRNMVRSVDPTVI